MRARAQNIQTHRGTYTQTHRFGLQVALLRGLNGGKGNVLRYTHHRRAAKAAQLEK